VNGAEAGAGGPDMVAIATLLVFVATLTLAGATVWLGIQARSEIRQARLGEVARRSELHILEADPLTAARRPADLDKDGQPMWALGLTNDGDRPVTAITATIRSDEIDASESKGRDSLAPGQGHVFRFRLGPYLQYADPATHAGLTARVGHCEIVVVSHGLFGQRVLQTFRIRVDRVAANKTLHAWYLTRQEIVPAVPGGTPSLTTFEGTG
jgi:hypothetical protein